MLMRSLAIAITLGAILLAASVASAGWTYVAPPVVYGYYPAGPVYAYPAPVPTVVARPIVPAPVYAPGPVVYPVGPAVYSYPYVVRTKVFVPGQPVRNTLRAVF